MKQKRNPRLLILRTLRDVPFLSESQLRWLLSWTQHVTQRHLWEVCHQGLVRRYPLFLGGKRSAQWLYALTSQGLQTLMRLEWLPQAEYQKKYRYSISRLRWLAMVLERVYQSRQVLRHLDIHSDGWHVVRWNSETEARYRIEKGWRRVLFHCSAIFENQAQNRWLPIMIEWDTGELPLPAERGRWQNFFKAHRDAARAGIADSQFPILFYVAADEPRLQEFFQLLCDLARVSHQIIPDTFLTWRAKFKEMDEADSADINAWYEPTEGVWVSQPLSRFEGVDEKPPHFWHTLPFRQGYTSTQVEIEPLSDSDAPVATSANLASLALALRPLDRKLLNAIGSHPLLTANELAVVLAGKPTSVWGGLARLRQWRLIQAHDCEVPIQNAAQWRRVDAYTLSELGLTALATLAGLGARPKRIALAHGWEKGVEPLVQHFRHTRIENLVHIQLLQYAQARGHPLTWLSEQEARLYLNVRNQKWSGPYESISLSVQYDRPVSEREEENAGEYEPMHVGSYTNRREFYRTLGQFGGNLVKFLPDGRGIYTVGDREWHLGLEVDLTRASHSKIRAKLNYYYWFHRIVPNAENLRVLIVTHHWERALNLYWLVWGEAADLLSVGWKAEWHIENETGKEMAEIVEIQKPQELIEHVMPVYITTVEELERNVIDQPIWLRVRERMGENNQVEHTFTRTNCMEGIEER